MRRAALTLFVIATLVAGCGASKSDPAPESATAADSGASVLITADWGTTVLADGAGRPGTLLAATQGVTPATTAYGGRYVTGLAGREGDGSRDWLFWLNGIEADVGAADLEVGAGDRIWWDLHRWAGRLHVPAVIGSWPAPIARGIDGVPSTVSADPPLAAALGALGVAADEPAASSGPRVVIGSDGAVRDRDRLWAMASAEPERFGLTAWVDTGRVVVWDAATGQVSEVPDASAVIVATTEDATARGAPVVFVIGTTVEAANRAAAALVAAPRLIHGHAAICLDAEGKPVCSGGRGLLP